MPGGSTQLEGIVGLQEWNEKDDEEDNERNYLRRERVYNKYSRSFYLGDVAEEEISAKFSDGTLTVVVPKKQEVETKKYIDIE